MNKEKHWKTINKREVYDGSPFLRVELHTVKLPDGRIINDYHRLSSGTYANIIPISREGKFFVLNQYRYGANRVGYALPGGKIEVAESPEAGAKRELLEETGLVSTSMDFLGKYNVSCSYGLSDNFFFLAPDAEPEEDYRCLKSDDLEISEVLLLSEHEVRRGIRDNSFVSLSHVAGISMAMLYLADR